MNILFTSDLSGMGGGETSLINLISILKQTNNVLVLCNTTGRLNDELKKINIPVFVLDYRNKKRLLINLLKIRKLVERHNIEVIHNNDPLTSVIMYYAVIGLHINTYWTCHGQWYEFSFIKRELIKKANRHIFCVSTKVKESLSRMGFKKISVSYLGIPLERYREAIPTNLRNELQVPDENILIACVGRFQPIKGQLKLVKALKRIKDEGMNISCLLVGGCVFSAREDEIYYALVKQYVKENGMENMVFFLGERNDIPSILKEIDGLIVPSDNESFGMVAIEALAAGTPVWSTPNDGVSEILNYNPQLISETNDVDGLVKAIRGIGKMAKRKEMLINDINLLADKYDINIIAAKYIDYMSDNRNVY